MEFHSVGADGLRVEVGPPSGGERESRCAVWDGAPRWADGQRAHRTTVDRRGGRRRPRSRVPCMEGSGGEALCRGGDPSGSGRPDRALVQAGCKKGARRQGMGASLGPGESESKVCACDCIGHCLQRCTGGPYMTKIVKQRKKESFPRRGGHAAPVAIQSPRRGLEALARAVRAAHIDASPSLCFRVMPPPTDAPPCAPTGT